MGGLLGGALSLLFAITLAAALSWGIDWIHRRS